jgi:hypothetical protein
MHIFTRPGDYTVTVTVADREGRRSTAAASAFIRAGVEKTIRLTTTEAGYVKAPGTFYLKNNIVKLIPRLKILYEKCKKEEEHFILDPWWIGGKDKYINTTRINVIFLLNPDPTNKEWCASHEERGVGEVK